jgi:hypothetical protein
MEADRFEHVVRVLSTSPSRRHALASVAGMVLGNLLPRDPWLASAKGKKGRGKKRKKKKGSSLSCFPNCASKTCGADGCGGSCGTCAGGTCPNGQCVCPFGSPCRPGVCCATGERCLGGSCSACPLGADPCALTQACGRTPGGRLCACVTSIANTAHCAATPADFRHCSSCATDEDCDAELGLPAGTAVCAVCVAECASGKPNLCMIKECVDA